MCVCVFVVFVLLVYVYVCVPTSISYRFLRHELITTPHLFYYQNTEDCGSSSLEETTSANNRAKPREQHCRSNTVAGKTTSKNPGKCKQTSSDCSIVIFTHTNTHTLFEPLPDWEMLRSQNEN